jgi:putative redox protein
MAEYINIVKSTFKGTRYRTELQVGDHVLIADEPIEQGGQNSGPEAHSILLSSLAACTTITIKMYVDRKGWDVGEIEVDCKLERSKNRGEQVSTAQQKIKFSKDLDDDVKKRILAISKKCPVHKTLSPAISIETIIE